MSHLVNSGHLRVAPAHPPGTDRPDAAAPRNSSPTPNPSSARTPQQLPNTKKAPPAAQSTPASTSVTGRVDSSAPIFAAAKQALDGAAPTVGACADFLCKSLQGHLPGIPTRTAASRAAPNRVYITVDTIKALHAAAAFITAETDKTADENLRTIQVSIQQLAAAQAATSTAIADMASKNQAALKAADEKITPREDDPDAGWTVVERRGKNRRTGHLPLSQRLPSTEIIFSALDRKKPPFKGAPPSEVVAKLRAALVKTIKEHESDWEGGTATNVSHMVRGARPLPSGDWIITFGTAKWARLASSNKSDWLDDFHPGFFLKDGEFEVAVDLVPLSFNMSEYSHYLDIVKNNPVVSDSTSVEWTGGKRGLEDAKAKKKRHGTLLIRFQRAADANDLIMAPLSLDGRLLPTRNIYLLDEFIIIPSQTLGVAASLPPTTKNNPINTAQLR
ncbi:hypothetical protein CF319_g9005 [Tilletia indica]|nr:hypothetical protein CF319_g9005 [Tilletia indica]